jgi:hypothetical protein
VLTADVRASIVKLVAQGNYLETAAAANGVSKQAIHAWMKTAARKEDPELQEFLIAIEKAKAESEAYDLRKIGMSDEWQAAAWRLERRSPDRWGRKARLDASITNTDPSQARVTWTEILESAILPAGDTGEDD